MRKLTLVLGIVLVIAFIILGINTIVSNNNKLKLREVQLKSMGSELKELESKYDVINKDLDKATNENKASEEEVKKLNDEKAELEKHKRELESQLQAKLEAKNKLASASANLVDTVTMTKTASASSGNVESIIRNAAIKNGLDPDWFYELAKCESTWNPSAVNYGYFEEVKGVRHYPSGLFQHLTNYWPKRAADHGYAGASVFDAEANANVTAAMWKSGSQLWECQ